jgi:hypothetical protein
MKIRPLPRRLDAPAHQPRLLQASRIDERMAHEPARAYLRTKVHCVESSWIPRVM